MRHQFDKHILLISLLKRSPTFSCQKYQTRLVVGYAIWGRGSGKILQELWGLQAFFSYEVSDRWTAAFLSVNFLG